ncbi:MlaA family lipoprotein [Roseateles flavus]|uniref:VacJ family lipoprotein n=1 Tax=Roseateles flavus TaxID=3149041 RepID=A0ABV0G8C7_9BURK
MPLNKLLLAACVLASGCATQFNPDPLELLNRKTFALNEGLDKAVLKPAAQAYKNHVPAPIRTGVSNVLSNLGEPWSGVNLILQGRLKEGLSDFGRFGTNTTVGLLGVMDVATGWGMPGHGESFNGTLRTWGVGGGAYLVLPLLGPADLRGLAAFPVDRMGSVQSQIDSSGASAALTATEVLDKRTSLLEVTRMIDELALDKYVFVRDAYLQRRAAQKSDADERNDSHNGSR